MPNKSPFLPDYEELPDSLSIFPLANAVMLPGGFLPLNVFEPRYVNMVQDALRDNQLIGMIQPKKDSWLATGEPDIYSIGCAGRIFKYQETMDGRIELALVGVSRFEVARELESVNGYRKVTVDWSDYRLDFDEPETVDRDIDDQFRAALRHYMNDQQLKTDWSTLEQLRIGDLCNSILSFLPLTSDDKQLLLETRKLSSRVKAFSAILLSARIGDNPTQH